MKNAGKMTSCLMRVKLPIPTMPDPSTSNVSAHRYRTTLHNLLDGSLPTLTVA